MNKYLIMSILCFIVGAVLLGLGISQGDGKVYWIVIIPVIEGTGVFSFLGILMIILGIILLMISFASGRFEWADLDDLEREEDRTRNRDYPAADKYGHTRPTDGRYTRPKPGGAARAEPADYRYRAQPRSGRPTIKTGGVVFIGPLPIIWGSDKKIGYIMAVVAFILAIIFLIFTLSFFL